MKELKPRKNQRSTTWAGIIYNENADVSNIKQYFDERGVRFYLSPLHCNDVKEDGTPKKAHWHILIKFHGLKSQLQVSQLLEPFTICLPIVVNDEIQYARYLIHADNPEKAQYNKDEVLSNGDYDYYFVDDISSNRFQAILKQIVDEKKNFTKILIDAISKDDKATVKVLKENIHLFKCIKIENNVY